MSRTLEIAFDGRLARHCLLRSNRAGVIPLRVRCHMESSAARFRWTGTPLRSQTLPRLCGSSGYESWPSEGAIPSASGNGSENQFKFFSRKSKYGVAQNIHHHRVRNSPGVRSMRAACQFEANLGRLRFVLLGSILAPIKRTKSGRLSELCLAESTDSLGRLQP
jgi:hypothetical protein